MSRFGRQTEYARVMPCSVNGFFYRLPRLASMDAVTLPGFKPPPTFRGRPRPAHPSQGEFRMTLAFRSLLVVAILGMAACAPLQTAQPVARQNQQNLHALGQNVQAMMHVSKPFVVEAGKNLIIQRVTQVLNEMISVVRWPQKPLSSQDWASLFQARGKAYADRFDYVQAALNRGLPEAELAKIRNREGWIFNAASNADFTPQQVFTLVDKVRKLDRVDKDAYYANAVTLLAPHDPTLAQYHDAVMGTQALYQALEREISAELTLAEVHAQAFLNFSEAAVDAEQAVGNISHQEVMAVVNRVGDKYIGNPARRDAAINLFNGTLGTVFKR